MRLLEAPVVEYDEDTYIARYPLIQGAFAQGDTPEEALGELIDVIKVILDYKRDIGEPFDEDMLVETRN